MHQSISRRSVLKRTVATAAALGLSGLSARAYSQVVGSNEDIHIGVIGFNGRGVSHIDAWKKMKGVRLVALCDADEKVLNKGYDHAMKPASPTTRPSTQPAAAEVSTAATQPEKPVYAIEKYHDLRKLLDNKHLDAISTATPNHWHSLITVWGCQAGKDVYVEKPVSHNVWEGRKSVEAARKYNRIVQTGTQNRSNPAITEAFKWVHEGNLGKVLIARGLCYKRRGSIGKVEAAPPVPASIDLDLWCGPSPKEAPHRKQFHYDWHWFWATGCGDIGNQGIHEMDKSRWALGKNMLAPKVMSIGGRFGYDDDGQTPNTQFAVHDYGDSLLIFEVRGLALEPGSQKMDNYKGESIGQVIECENGYLSGTVAYDSDGKEIRNFNGKSEEHFEGDHFANFIHAVRSRKVADLHADILEGHLSSALCHTSNISYRLGQKADQGEIKEAIKSDKAAMETFERFQAHLAKNEVDITMEKATLGPVLTMDPKTERFVDNAEANALLSRAYRKPFVVPEMV
ncbi:MAG TPA: Gfo/Idh/MocA family oxidoreductase [Tepidisphaeraceae bacterium]|nr:Gfo/Idh/MocA family oxidoreductase [Tepidisphaeraceae bacterium]